MFEQLFGSKTRVKLLQLFFTNPNRSFYVREITRKVDEQINSVRRELSNLLSIGIIKSDANNNRLYYEVDQSYEFYSPLSMIFGGVPIEAAKPAKKSKEKNKTEAEPREEAPKKAASATDHPLAKDLRSLGRVELVVFTGQFTRDEASGIDVLLVGDINQTKVVKFMSELEKTENKELRYVVMTPSNYQYRVQINDRFINNLLGSKKQVIIDTQNLVNN
ncbi:MAG TPA: transcriptional regulator [Candidatus Saccharimonadales bacterium]|nr:transcriptional regulator [Candidatus Saccharimonadales bacterium]